MVSLARGVVSICRLPETLKNKQDAVSKQINFACFPFGGREVVSIRCPPQDANYWFRSILDIQLRLMEEILHHLTVTRGEIDALL